MRPSAANRSFSRKIRLTAAGLSSGGRIGLHVEQFGFVIERLVGPHSQRPVALGTVGQRGRNPQFHGTAAAQQLAAQGAVYAVVPLKDTAGSLYYASQVPAAAGSVAANPVDAAAIARVFKANGITPVAQLAAFRDPAGARADHAMAIRYKGQEYLWLDNKASAGGNPWLNPYAAEAVQYIGDLIEEAHGMGFDQVLLKNVQFPSSTSSKQDYGSTNGVDRAGQLAADIAAWQSRFGTEVTLWYGYSLSQVTDAASALGVPAAQLGMKNLLVEVPGSSTLDEAGRTTLTRMLEDAGVEHTVIRDDAAGRFE